MRVNGHGRNSVWWRAQARVHSHGKRITDYFLSSATLPTGSSETTECPPSKRPRRHTRESGFNEDWLRTFPWVIEVESKGMLCGESTIGAQRRLLLVRLPGLTSLAPPSHNLA